MNRTERGAAAVEFALVVPVLFLVLLGIVEFGFQYNRQLEYSNAAMIGAREMATGGHVVGSAQARAAEAAGVPLSAVTVDPASCTTTSGAGSNATVTIAVSESLTGLFDQAIRIEGRGVARCE